MKRMKKNKENRGKPNEDHIFREVSKSNSKRTDDSETGASSNAGQSSLRCQNQDKNKIDTPIVIKISKTKIVEQSEPKVSVNRRILDDEHTIEKDQSLKTQNNKQLLPKTEPRYSKLSSSPDELDSEHCKRYPELNALLLRNHEKGHSSKDPEEIELVETNYSWKNQDPEDESHKPKQDSEQCKHPDELDSEQCKRYPQLNSLVLRKHEKGNSSKDPEEIELVETNYSWKNQDPDSEPPKPEPYWWNTVCVDFDGKKYRLPPIWGWFRLDVQTEFPTKDNPDPRPQPSKGPRGRAAYDLSEYYSNIMPPLELKISDGDVGPRLFNPQGRTSWQETHPWTDVAKLYLQDLPENAHRGPIAPINKTNASQVGKSQDMRIQELKETALRNVIHHKDFKDVKATLTKRSNESTNGANEPALLVHNGISFWSGIREQKDNSWENQTERQWRLQAENHMRQTQNLHDFEVIFDTEVNLPGPSTRIEDVEEETSHTDYVLQQRTPRMDTTIQGLFWAFVKIDLFDDGSKAYDVRRPSRERPNCPIPDGTHRHFVLSPLVEAIEDAMQETDPENQADVLTQRHETVATYWAVARIELLQDGTKIYKIRTPCPAKPRCQIPEESHRIFIVSPTNVFNRH